MSNKLSKQTGIERELLARLIETHRPLLVKCVDTSPDPIELSALAAMLHSLYTGIENIFKRMAREVDGALPTGEFWHRDLLAAMARPNASRKALISEGLRDQLREYLEFRHVFRQAYSFQLQWEKMAHLVLDSEQVLKALEAELDIFFLAEEE